MKEVLQGRELGQEEQGRRRLQLLPQEWGQEPRQVQGCQPQILVKRLQVWLRQGSQGSQESQGEQGP